MYHLRLFGITQLVDPTGEPVSLKRKHLALLVVLSLEARFRPVSRGRLIDLLWPAVPVAKGSHSLSQACTMIRNTLGREAISRFDQEIRLTSDLTTDLDSMAPMTFQAADLSRPLAGLDGCAGTSWAHWVDTVREQCLSDMRVRLLSDLNKARSQGDLDTVYDLATLLYAVDPLNDIAALSLAERLLAKGDTVGAMRFVRQHIAHTHQALERDPPHDLKILLKRLEQGTFKIMGGEPSFETVAVGSSRPEVFIGRQPELSRLEALWARAREGKLVTCLVSGPGGMGKSTLIRRFTTTLASRTWPAYLISCQEIGQNIPFSVVSDLTHQLAGDPAAGGTDQRWLSEASRVAPGLTTIYSGIAEPPPAPAEAVHIRTAEAILQILAVVSDEGPLLLAFDDIQYMDLASCEVIHVLAKRLAERQVLFLATRRSSEYEHRRVRTEAAGIVDWHEEFELPPIPGDTTLDLVKTLCNDPEDIADDVSHEIVRLSQGNPYLTEMLLSDWQNNAGDSLVAVELGGFGATAEWHPPKTMERAYKRQYQDLSADSEQLLNLLAVAGRSITTTELEGLLGFDRVQLDRSALELIDRAIVRTTGGMLGYRNELHRAFVYRAMSVDARVYHHARLAKFLTETRTEQDFQRALEASHHFVRAGMTNEAVEAVCIGADLAVTKGAPREAERALQRVLAHSPPEALSQLGMLMARALSAQQRFRESLNALPSIDEVTSRSDAALILTLRAEALHRARLGDTKTVQAVAASAVSMSTQANDQLLALTSQQILAEIASEEERWAEIQQIEIDCERVARVSRSEEVRALALYTLGYCRLANGDVDAATDSLAQSCQGFEALGHQPNLHRALNGLGMCYTKLGETEKAVNVLRHSVRVAENSSDFVASANARSNLGAVYNEMGQFSAAKDVFAASTRLLGNSGNSRVPTAIYCNAAILTIMLGSFVEAEELLDRANKAAAQSRIWQHSISVLLTRADLCLAIGQRELAWELLDQATSRVSGRAQQVPDIGQYWRLRQQFLWATGHELSSFHNGLYPLKLKPTIGLAHWLEIRAFEEWVRAQQGDSVGSSKSVVHEIIQTRLFGVLARLASVHVRLDPIPEPADGESAAALVARTFQGWDAGAIPIRLFDTPLQT